MKMIIMAIFTYAMFMINGGGGFLLNPRAANYCTHEKRKYPPRTPGSFDSDLLVVIISSP